VLPKSPEGCAVRYALKNWKALTRYSEAGIRRSTTTVRSAPSAAWQ
jgi:hypothetical protein